VRRRALVPAVAMVFALASCGGSRGPTTPSPPPASGPVLIEQSGPVEIAFVDATPSFGSTVSGCGARIDGCVNRIVMQFLLRAQEPGPGLGVRAFLHATNLQACLSTTTGPFDLARGETRPLSIVFDQSDLCPVPLTIATMAVVVEGTVQVASRRAWAVTYTFAP
jgi:hypothetical protein